MTIEESDHVERIGFPESDDLALALYLKAAPWHDQRSQPVGVPDWCPPGKTLPLLTATVPSPQFEVVNWVLPVPAQIVAADATALGALRRLCERFGTTIRLGAESGRLMESVIVPGEPGLPLSLDRAQDDRSGFGFICSRYDHDRRAFLVSLAFLLDVQALRSELMSQGVGRSSK